MDIEEKPAWQERCIAATKGNQTQFGAILLAAMGRSGSDAPRFGGRATKTSDGYLISDYVDRDGRYHMGAFVGSMTDLDANVEGLAKHLSLDPAEHAALARLIAAWVQS